ncbi:hypothetical protein NDK50_15090 [Paraburkholderia bryophila]|uniref:hypothetical protein n=1 Tax=Paraburkholderia bryophila TaxID=420952 RepID=UPI00234BE58D|nr:hypothetical protein [Paraburkholderia bryophila]WCM18755.1 hypothetical protein NDK50_15090 [Paraburkholderia bryophila]
MKPYQSVIVPHGNDLCFTHLYQGEPRLVNVTADALDKMRAADPTSNSRTRTLRDNLEHIVSIAERKIDHGELPVVYPRDVASTY